MDAAVLEVFERLCASNSYEHSLELLLDYPVLFSPWHWTQLEAVAEQRGISREELRNAQETMKRVLRAIDAAEEPIAARCRPLEQIWVDVTLGKTTHAHALRCAAEPAAYSLLSPIGVYVEGRMAERILRDNPAAAHTRQQIVLAALDARRAQTGKDQAAMETIAVIYWLDVCTRLLCDVPYSQVFFDALQRGQALAAEQDVWAPFPPGEIYHRLGVLHLDPYVVGRTPFTYEHQLQLWHQQLREAYGSASGAGTSRLRKLPDLKVALRTAASYLETAASMRGGESRGRTLKALCQALQWLGELDAKREAPRLVELAREGESLLSQDRYPVEHYYFSLLLDSYGGASLKRPKRSPGAECSNPASDAGYFGCKARKCGDL
jgi:hypothetical protein